MYQLLTPCTHLRDTGYGQDVGLEHDNCGTPRGAELHGWLTSGFLLLYCSEFCIVALQCVAVARAQQLWHGLLLAAVSLLLC